VEAIAAAKWELAESLPPASLLVLNGDDERLRRLAKHYRGETLWFGRRGECDVSAEGVHYQNGHLSFRVESQRFWLPVWGRHHLASALAAIAVGTAYGLTYSEIADALAQYQPVRGRCSVVQADGVTVIDDTYNASPSGMLAALELLRESTCDGRKILVCGDMGELGESSQDLHARLGEWIADRSPKLLFACGEFAANVSAGSIAAGMNPERVVVRREPLQLLDPLQQELRPGDMVLVKGCRAMGLERIVEQIAAPQRMRVAV
ncbi:MAG: cyanophycin synthetase, partial [Pirellulales bacterium]